MKNETLITLLTDLASMLDRPGGCEGGGAIALMAAAELQRLKWLDRHPDIRQHEPTSH